MRLESGGGHPGFISLVREPRSKGTGGSWRTLREGRSWSDLCLTGIWGGGLGGAEEYGSWGENVAPPFPPSRLAGIPKGCVSTLPLRSRMGGKGSIFGKESSLSTALTAMQGLYLLSLPLGRDRWPQYLHLSPSREFCPFRVIAIS